MAVSVPVTVRVPVRVCVAVRVFDGVDDGARVCDGVGFIGA